MATNHHILVRARHNLREDVSALLNEVTAIGPAIVGRHNLKRPLQIQTQKIWRIFGLRLDSKVNIADSG